MRWCRAAWPAEVCGSRAGRCAGSRPGRGSPAIVLEAGATDTSIAWAPILAPLAARTPIVAYDRAGLGASDAGQEPPSVDRQVADLAAVVSEAGGGEPCVIVAHSWGGLLAQLLAFRTPELVAGLVLVDPAHEGMADGLPRAVRWLARNGRLRLDGLILPVERWLALRGIERSLDDPNLRALVVGAWVAGRATRPRRQAIRAEYRAIVSGQAGIRRARAAASLPDVPIMVISATRGFPPSVRKRWSALQADVAAAGPNGRLVVVPGAGHAVQHERPDVVVEAVLQVLAEVRAQAGRPARACLSDPGWRRVHLIRQE